MKAIIFLGAIVAGAWYLSRKKSPVKKSQGAGNEDYEDNVPGGEQNVSSFWDGGNWGLPKFGE